MGVVKRYGHGLILVVYGIVYMLFFTLLERRQVAIMHPIQSPMDDTIPFCEYFVLPYLMWFPFVFFGVLYFVFVSDDRKEYYRLAYMMMFGMTEFLLVSFFYPNMQVLRPYILPRDNFCSDLVKFVYKVDTPTNVLPSMHVYISLAVCVALVSCKGVKNARHTRAIRAGVILMTLLIIISTVYIKQHSLVDVIAAYVVATIAYVVFYNLDYFEPLNMVPKEDSAAVR